MILADSVVIDYLRTSDPKLLAVFQGQSAAICGATRAEVLTGARSAAHRQRLNTALDTFHQLLMPESLWIRVGDNLAAMRAKGITVSLADAIIATVAIENDLELWARDAHFTMIQGALPQLKLFQEPP
jgi:predicted nucleic acid-binding protein